MELSLLNTSLQTVQYNGSFDDESHKIDNLLLSPQEKKRNIHCSKDGSFFDWILSSKQVFTLTHVVVKAPIDCTSPIRSGIMIVTDEKPFSILSISNYEHMFHKANLTAVEADKLFSHIKQNNWIPSSAYTLFFELDEVNYTFEKEIQPWVKGKYVYIKFIGKYGEDANYDVETIALIGYPNQNAASKSHSLGKVSADLYEVPVPNIAEFSMAFAGDIIRKNAIFGFNMDISTLEQLSNQTKDFIFTYGDKDNLDLVQFLTIFKFDTSAETKMLIAFMFGEGDSQDPAIYCYEGDFSDISAMSKFVADAKEGKLTRYTRKQARPVNDEDPDHPNVKIVVTESFDEIVLNPNKSTFLDVWASWCGPCIAFAPVLYKVADILKDVKEIQIAKMDSDYNESPHIKVTTIPHLEFFPHGDKAKSVRYTGDRTVAAVIKFIHEHSGKIFELEPLVKEAEEASKVLEKKQALAMMIQFSAQSLDIYGETMAQKEKDDLQRFLEFLGTSFDRMNLTQIDEAIKQITNKFEPLNQRRMLEQQLSEMKSAAEMNVHMIREAISAYEDKCGLLGSEKEAIEAALVSLEKAIERGDIGAVQIELTNLSEVAEPFMMKVVKETQKEESKKLKKVVILADEDDFEKHINSKSHSLVVIDFTASWCGPCKAISPKLADMSEEFPKALFVKVDIDDYPAIAEKYQVESVPTFLFFKQGELLSDKIEGANAAGLRKIVESHCK